jgi:3-hydroxybutyryl-CoA dehydratase
LQLSYDQGGAKTAPEADRKSEMNLISRHVYFFEDLEVGLEASFAKTVSQADMVAFVEVTGDKNPGHLDGKYAATTIFRTPIAHGMLR